MARIYGLWLKAIPLLLTSASLLTIAEAQACYTRTVLCEDFSTNVNHCSDIRSFGVSRIETTDGFVSQYAIRLITSYSVPSDTAVRVVTCSTPSECNLDDITADSCYGNSSCECVVLSASNAEKRVSFRCGHEEFSRDGTTVVWFQLTPDCNEMPRAIVLILRIEGVVPEESEVCYPQQVLCPVYRSGCSNNITAFESTRPGAITTYTLTFNSSAIQLNSSSDYEVLLQSSCSVGEISLGNGDEDECHLLHTDEDHNSIRFNCGREGIRGITANAGVVLFTPSDPMQPIYVGNGTTFVVVQRGEVEDTDLPDCSVLDNIDDCSAVCSSYMPSNGNSVSPCTDDFCVGLIGGFCGTNCTSNDAETLLRCESLCCDNYDAVNSTCPQNPCTDSFSRDCGREVGVSASERAILDQCLSPCLRQQRNRDVNITCPGAVCNRLLNNCTRSPLYRLQCEEDEYLPLCQMTCTDTGAVNSLVNPQCEDAYSDFEVFCSEEFSVDGTCEDLPLFNISCNERRATCRLVCTGNMRDLDRRCGSQSRDFCRTFFEDLLNETPFFDTRNITSAIDALLKFTITSGLRRTRDSMQSLFSYFDRFVDETRDFVASEENATLELVETFEYLFADNKNDDWNNLIEENADISQTLQNAENLAGIIGESRAASNASFVFGGGNILMHAVRPSLANTEGGVFVFPSRNVFNTSTLSGARMEIPVELLCEDGIDGCSTVVSSMVINNLATYLDNIAPEDNRTVNSFLLSTQVFGASTNLSSAISEHPIKLYFTPLMNNGSTDLNSSAVCVFWDFDASQWSSDGISTEVVNSSVLCQPTHLTSFAVLVRVTSPETPTETPAPETIALQVVSYVGCAISIVSLIITIILLLIFRKSLNKGALLYVHLNLAIALLIALVIFVAGIETATPVPWLCTTIAALLHYFFLCVFCWMLAEGIMLYLLVVRVFGRAAEKWYYLLILGWGLPIPIVAISVGILHNDYRTDNYCWIRADPTSAAIWTFVVPMLVTILVNSVILVMTVVSMVRGRIRAGAEEAIKTRELIKSTLKATIFLLPLLGLTWVLGLFAVNENTQVFAWLFTIFNSLQGFFILVFHVLRNEAVRNKFRRRVRRRLTYMAKPGKDYMSPTNAGTMDTKETRLDATSGLFPLVDLGNEELDHKNIDHGVTTHEVPDES